MFDIKYLYKIILIGLVSILLISCSEEKTHSTAAEGVFHLDVYKARKCSCCSKWINIVREQGFESQSHNQSQYDLSRTKDKHRVPKNMRSCHTSVTSDGYVFEGHIPAKYIQKFLKEKPEGAFGLAVPAMPTGSPGMEFGEMFMAYKIYLLKDDGTFDVYANIEESKEQYDE